MTQTFNDIPSTFTLQNSRQPLLERDNAAASNFSGTAFPSTNLLVGMRCHRTDLNKIYALKDLTPTWVEIADISGTSGLAPQATKLATARAISISGDATATGINFDGTAAVALSLTLAASGATAGTYTKVTVDAKGRVTAGTAITNADLPTAISQATLRATSTTAITLASTAHGFQTGADASTNVAISPTAIQARNNGSSSILAVNGLGGDVSIGDGTTSQITLAGTFNAASLIKATQAEAEAGAVTNKLMTPLQTAQAIALLGGVNGVNMQVFVASGTYTPTAGYRYAIAFVTGGGGGGGGGYNSGSHGGAGAGGTTIGVLNLTTLGSVTVTVGAGGAGGSGSSASTSNGNAGGNSSLSGLVGYGGGANQTGGLANGGAINIQGGQGGDVSASTGAAGGASFWGGGGGRAEGGASGNAGPAYGAGGGAGDGQSSGYVSGGAGKSGVVMILEFK